MEQTLEEKINGLPIKTIPRNTWDEKKNLVVVREEWVKKSDLATFIQSEIEERGREIWNAAREKETIPGTTIPRYKHLTRESYKASMENKTEGKQTKI